MEEIKLLFQNYVSSLIYVFQQFSNSNFHKILYCKLFTFLSIDMEILTLWSSQVHPEAQAKGVQATEGC